MVEDLADPETECIVISRDSYEAICDHLGMTAVDIGDEDGCATNSVDELLERLQSEASQSKELSVVQEQDLRTAADLFEFLYEESEEYHQTEKQFRELASSFRAAVRDNTRH